MKEFKKRTPKTKKELTFDELMLQVTELENKKKEMILKYDTEINSLQKDFKDNLFNFMKDSSLKNKTITQIISSLEELEKPVTNELEDNTEELETEPINEETKEEKELDDVVNSFSHSMGSDLFKKYDEHSD